MLVSGHAVHSSEFGGSSVPPRYYEADRVLIVSRNGERQISLIKRTCHNLSGLSDASVTQSDQQTSLNSNSNGPKEPE